MIRNIVLLACLLALGGCSWFPQIAFQVDSSEEGIDLLEEAALYEVSVTTEPVPEKDPIIYAPEEDGPRFDIKVEGVDAAPFFRSLVHDTPFNMVVHPQVAGKVTLQLENVTVGEVMLVMRDVYGYDFTLEGSVYQVFPDVKS